MQIVMSQKSYAGAVQMVIHRRAMQIVMSQKSYADGDVTEELCR